MRRLIAIIRGRAGVKARPHSDPLKGITSFMRMELVHDGGADHYHTDVKEAPIEEHPNFGMICARSAWQRERFVRAGNAWIHPDCIKA